MRITDFLVITSLLQYALAAIAQAPDFSADRAASRQIIERMATTTAPAVQQRDYGNIDTSKAATLGSHTQSLAAHRTANISRIDECNAKANTNYSGVTDQEKVDCQAVITAAGILFTPNPYLDTSSPKVTENVQATKSMRATQKNALALVKSGAITSPLPFTSTTNCAPQSSTTPPVSRLDSCRAEKPVSPITCAVTVSNSLVDGKIVSRDDASLCAPYAANPTCIPGGTSCSLETDVDTGAKDSAGNPVLSRVCATKTQGYTCWGVNDAWNLSNCAQLAANPLCAQTGTEIAAQLVAGVPVWADIQYSCVMTPEQVAVTSGCQSTTCVGGTCFDTTPAANQDFASMAVGMEMVREAGVYSTGGEDSLRVFKGAGSNCTRPTGIGIGANCCNASGAPLIRNREILPAIAWQAAGSVVASAGRYGVQQATTYTYDFMMGSGSEWMQAKAWEALGSGAYTPGGPSFGLSMGAYGFSAQIGAQSTLIPSLLPQSVTAAYNAATIPLGETVIAGNTIQFTFNPYMLAAVVALQMIQEMNSCSIDEKLLSARRGGDLCVRTGEHCSMQLPWPLKTCIQITEEWCCWNSRLAQVIAVQGGAQLGGGPRCGGFSPDELTQIDFSKIDFSSFAAEMRASVVLPDPGYNVSTASQASLRANAARDAVDQSPATNSASDSSLQGYVQGRIQTMMVK